MIINNLKELKKRKTLEKGDTVIFNVLGEEIEYTIWLIWLHCCVASRANDHIFDKLKLDKLKLATECYGYKPLKAPLEGDWPEYKYKDYKAATRLVKRLYEIIEERWSPEVFNPIASRFDILDIR